MRPLKRAPAILKEIQCTHKDKCIRLSFRTKHASARKAASRHVCGRAPAPPGLCDRRFTFAYIFAAVEPGTDNGFALVMPYADTEAMQEFLNQFSETIAPDEHAVMILDQAGWHGSNALAVPANVTLIPLPPYSPELNPVERVWLYLKERFLSHRLLDDYDAIVTAACNAWNRLLAEAGSRTLLLPMDTASQCLGSTVSHDPARTAGQPEMERKAPRSRLASSGSNPLPLPRACAPRRAWQRRAAPTLPASTSASGCACPASPPSPPPNRAAPAASAPR